MDVYQQQAALLKAMAHPVRLRILEILGEEESCVCHLTHLLKQRQPYVSQQLMLLREAGMVLDRRDGVTIYYRLADEGVTATLRAARALLPAGNGGAGSEPVHRSPVTGCPCPKCADDEAGSCS